MKGLKRRDRPILQTRHQKQPSTSHQRNSHQLLAPAKNIIDGLHLPISSDPFTPLLAQLTHATRFSSAQIEDTDPEIEIIKVWTEEEFQAEANSTPQCYRSSPRRRKLKHSLIEISPQGASPSRSKRNVGRLEGTIVERECLHSLQRVENVREADSDLLDFAGSLLTLAIL